MAVTIPRKSLITMAADLSVAPNSSTDIIATRITVTAVAT